MPVPAGDQSEVMILAGGGEKGAVGALGQLMANMKASFVKPKSRTSGAAQARAPYGTYVLSAVMPPFAVTLLLVALTGTPDAAYRRARAPADNVHTTAPSQVPLRAIRSRPARGDFTLPTSLAGATINVNSTLQSPGNSGDCTLGEAILAANQNVPIDGCNAGSGVDTIVLTAGTYTLTTVDNTHERVGPLGLPIIFSDVIIQGAGAANTIVERDQSAPTFTLLALPDPYFIPGAGSGSLVLNDLTMRGGSGINPGGGAISAGDRTVTLNNVIFDNNSAPTGGAISSFGYATINANNCIFTNNRASGSGGAIAAPYLTITKSTFNGNSAVYGGAIGFAQGGSAIARIVDSTFINNSVTGSGGALRLSGQVTISGSTFDGNSANDSGAAGAIDATGDLNISDSTITNNHANDSGGILASGTNFSPFGTPGALIINRCNISNNTANVSGGGLSVKGVELYFGIYHGTISNTTIAGNTANVDGGGMVSSLDLILVNTTIDGNTAHRYGGGVYSYDHVGGQRTTLNNVTISGNHADGSGGGFFRDSGDVQFKNTIIALNTSGANDGQDIYAPQADPIISRGYNLISIKDGANFTNATGDQTGTALNPINPLLGPLQANGGPAPTRVLHAGSPALDAGNPATADSTGDSCQPTDERGVSRPQVGDSGGLARCDMGAVERSSGQFEFSAATYSVDEGGGTLTVSVSRGMGDF